MVISTSRSILGCTSKLGRAGAGSDLSSRGHRWLRCGGCHWLRYRGNEWRRLDFLRSRLCGSRFYRRRFRRRQLWLRLLDGCGHQ